MDHVDFDVSYCAASAGWFAIHKRHVRIEESRMRLEEDAALSRSLRTPRAAGIAGVLFAVLLTAALVLVRLAAPADPADAAPFLGEPAKRRLVILALSLVPF